MLGQLPPRPPAPLWDSGVITSGTAEADLDIAGIEKLRLVVVDRESYDPMRVKAGWIQHPDFPLEGVKGEIQTKGADAPSEALLIKLPSDIVIDTKGRSRFRARVGSDASTLSSDIAPKLRFFVFRADVEPEPKALTGVTGDPPVPAVPVPEDRDRLIASLFRHALGREPERGEREIAKQMLNSTSDPAAGLEDLLWTLVLSPEFQYVR